MAKIGQYFDKILDYFLVMFIVVIFGAAGILDIFKIKIISQEVVDIFSLTAFLYALFLKYETEKKLARKFDFSKNNSNYFYKRGELLMSILLFIISVVISRVVIVKIINCFEISYNGFSFLALAITFHSIYTDKYVVKSNKNVNNFTENTKN